MLTWHRLWTDDGLPLPTIRAEQSRSSTLQLATQSPSSPSWLVPNSETLTVGLHAPQEN
jgi:hypothetical protein